jgi:D-glycero-beta-D-manno-heptose-7-phosphate kinase
MGSQQPFGGFSGGPPGNRLNWYSRISRWKPFQLVPHTGMVVTSTPKEQLLQIIEKFGGCPIAVYGDLVADEFIYGEISRISREAPVLILKYKESRIVPGGAANAINNLRALDAVPMPLGILGTDEAGKTLRELFSRAKIPLSAVRPIEGYQTPTKTRYSAGSVHSSRQQVLRIDRETAFIHTSESRATTEACLDSLLKQCRGLLVSDYGFGFVDPEIVHHVARKKGALPITLDSRFGLLRFSGLTACTPNESEVEDALGDKIGNNLNRLEETGKILLERLQHEAVLITRGRDGMSLFVSGQKPAHIPIFGSDEIADVTGAGDTVIAVFTLALAVGASFREAAKLSNYAGAIVVMKHGTATVSAEELREAVIRGEEELP